MSWGVRVRSLSGDGCSVHFQFNSLMISNTQRQHAQVCAQHRSDDSGFDAQRLTAGRRSQSAEGTNKRPNRRFSRGSPLACAFQLVGGQTGRRFAFNPLPSSLVRARLSPASPAPGAFARRIAVPAINRAITTRLKRNGGRLATTRTNHRSSLRRSRTVAGSSLVGLLCLAARLTALWCRVTAFLKELLIGRTEGKLLPTVAACNLHISGHMTPCVGLYSPICIFFARILFDRAKKDIDPDLKSSRAGSIRPLRVPRYSLSRAVFSRLKVALPLAQGPAEFDEERTQSRVRSGLHSPDFGRGKTALSRFDSAL